jgi:hypothetical protein
MNKEKLELLSSLVAEIATDGSRQNHENDKRPRLPEHLYPALYNMYLHTQALQYSFHDLLKMVSNKKYPGHYSLPINAFMDFVDFIVGEVHQYSPTVEDIEAVLAEIREQEFDTSREL